VALVVDRPRTVAIAKRVGKIAAGVEWDVFESLCVAQIEATIEGIVADDLHTSG